MNRLVASGAFFFAPTILKGRTAMRVAIVNFRTREADLEALLDQAAHAGAGPGGLNAEKAARRRRKGGRRREKGGCGHPKLASVGCPSCRSKGMARKWGVV